MSEWHRMISSEWEKQGIIGKQGIRQRSFPVCVHHVNNLWEWKKYNGPNTRPINGIRVQYQLQLATIINTLKYTCLYGWARETEKKDSTTKKWMDSKSQGTVLEKMDCTMKKILTKRERVIWNNMQSWQHTLSLLPNVSGSGWCVWPVEVVCLPTGPYQLAGWWFEPDDEGLH